MTNYEWCMKYDRLYKEAWEEFNQDNINERVIIQIGGKIQVYRYIETGKLKRSYPTKHIPYM